jgi:DNA (cytosine-5)-methyltransferase 1
MFSVYYNENDPYAAQWLRNLIDAGHIAPGFVDERSITDVRPRRPLGICSVPLLRWNWADGLTPHVLPAGLTTGLLRHRLVPLPTLQRRRKRRRLRRRQTPLARLVQPHRTVPHLQSSLVNRLRGKDGLTGSTLYSLTWKQRITPLGRSISALAGVGAPHIRQRLWFVAQRLADSDNAQGIWRGQSITKREAMGCNSTMWRIWRDGRQRQHGTAKAGIEADGSETGKFRRTRWM